MYDSWWVSVSPFKASEQHSPTSRTGFPYGLLGNWTEFMDESYWISARSVWPPERNSSTRRTGCPCDLSGTRKEFKDESYWMSALTFGAVEQNSSTRRTGFMHGLFGEPRMSFHFRLDMQEAGGKTGKRATVTKKAKLRNRMCYQ